MAKVKPESFRVLVDGEECGYYDTLELAKKSIVEDCWGGDNSVEIWQLVAEGETVTEVKWQK